MTIAGLRAFAIRNSLFAPTTLRKAIARLGFVQADPIRSPARAQDLILRHRVRGYRAGDLDRRFRSLDLEEDVLYAYGFLPRETARLLHPRDKGEHSELAASVLELLKTYRHLHPREIDLHLNGGRTVNPWGGFSKATTRVMESLHYRGLLRVAHRREGTRIYETAIPHLPHSDQAERLRSLVLLAARIFAPAPEKRLQRIVTLLRYAAPNVEGLRTAVKTMLGTGELEAVETGGTRYVWPTGTYTATHDVPVEVKFLAPFDPLVWDRERFELFWGWPYRFEAYTPPQKRKIGYYAMPLLWVDKVIGWANVTAKAGELDVQLGFQESRPRSVAFTRALDEEVERMRVFLMLAPG